MNQREYKLMQIIQKVEAFSGLEVSEFQRLLGICKPQNFEPESQIYGAGQESGDMLIVLAGKLRVESRSGEVLGEVSAGTSLGEMGMFTGEPRSATVIAAERTGAMLMDKDALMALMKQDSQLRGKILQNIVDILSERVIEGNRKMEEQSRRIHQLEAQLGAGSGASLADDDPPEAADEEEAGEADPVEEGEVVDAGEEDAG